MALYDHVDQCRAMLGCVWLSMSMYVYVWLCKAMYGYVRLCMAM